MKTDSKCKINWSGTSKIFIIQDRKRNRDKLQYSKWLKKGITSIYGLKLEYAIKLTEYAIQEKMEVDEN